MQAKAVRIREPGGPDVLEIGEHEVRDPGPGEVRVAVAAAGLNRADVLQRRGLYPAPRGYPEEIPGLEYAGEVESVGTGVLEFAVGDRVMGITGGGAMSTHIVAHAREVIRAPKGMKLEDAAAIPEAFLTVQDALFEHPSVGLGDVVLVHAVGSGIGTAALQLCLHAGATVIGTSRSEGKLARAGSLGLRYGINTADGSFVEAIRQIECAKDKGGVDFVLDTIGAKYAVENLKATRPRGTIVTIGLLGGAKAEVPIGLLLAKRLTWHGSVLRARPLEEKGALAQRFTESLLPLFDDGRLQPVVDAVLPMSEVAAAHQRMDASDTFGKIVLAW